MTSGRWLAAALLLALAAAAPQWVGATVFAPMRDETLVTSSDLIVLGRVGRIETVLLGGDRIVTRITLGVERAFKGRPTSDAVVVTEPGGQVGGRRLVVFGAPEYATGERALVFLRRRQDGTLGTNALALGKYRIEDDAAGAPLARRRLPTLELRPLDAFTARIAALAAGAPGAETDGRAGAAIALPDASEVRPEFALLANPGELPARWAEADCGIPVVFDKVGGGALGGAAIAAGTAAWSSVDGASLELAVGAATGPRRSLFGGTIDGSNTVQFDDPFGDIPDPVGCEGVLAIGGYVGSADQALDLRQRVGYTDFGRIFEADVTVNPFLGQCFGGSGVAEIVAHELGHTVGLGHSSENPNEPNFLLRDALMYFLAHVDGRGASLRQDDMAALQLVYPSAREATTPVGGLACRFRLGLVSVACLGQPLPAGPLARFRKARAAANRAARASVPAKQQRFLERALSRLDRAARAVTATIHGPCGRGMLETLAELRQELVALLAAP